MLYSEMIAVCSQIHTKHISTAMWVERRIVECLKHFLELNQINAHTCLLTTVHSCLLCTQQHGPLCAKYDRRSNTQTTAAPPYQESRMLTNFTFLLGLY